MSKDLITLVDHNESVVIQQSKSFEMKLNGIECPDCSYELTDNSPKSPQFSALAETDVKCFKCGFQGVRY